MQIKIKGEQKINTLIGLLDTKSDMFVDLKNTPDKLFATTLRLEDYESDNANVLFLNEYESIADESFQLNITRPKDVCTAIKLIPNPTITLDIDDNDRCVSFINIKGKGRQINMIAHKNRGDITNGEKARDYLSTIEELYNVDVSKDSYKELKDFYNISGKTCGMEEYNMDFNTDGKVVASNEGFEYVFDDMANVNGDENINIALTFKMFKDIKTQGCTFSICEGLTSRDLELISLIIDQGDTKIMILPNV